MGRTRRLTPLCLTLSLGHIQTEVKAIECSSATNGQFLGRSFGCSGLPALADFSPPGAAQRARELAPGPCCQSRSEKRGCYAATSSRSSAVLAAETSVATARYHTGSPASARSRNDGAAACATIDTARIRMFASR